MIVGPPIALVNDKSDTRKTFVKPADKEKETYVIGQKVVRPQNDKGKKVPENKVIRNTEKCACQNKVSKKRRLSETREVSEKDRLDIPECSDESILQRLIYSFLPSFCYPSV